MKSMKEQIGDRRRVQWRYRKVSPLLFLEVRNVDVQC